MRFMAMVKGCETNRMPPPELMEAIDRLTQEGAKAGFVMIESGGLAPTAKGGVRVRLDEGKVNVIDGPFSEAKEVVGGYAIYEAPTLEDAVMWTRRFMDLHRQHWPGWEGETELRQIFGPEDFAEMMAR